MNDKKQRERVRKTVTRVRSAKTWKPKLSGGPTTHPRKVPALLLRRGAMVELEHTKDPRIAVEIALSHLLERLDYYEQLAKAEGAP